MRFVQLYSGGGPVAMQWDAHDDIDANHEKMCGLTDKPVAALLTDLKRTGLLEETLVVWGGEFGRTPVRQKGGRGRDHNATGFTMWMAGGGVKGGTIVGATDEIGLKADRGPRPRQRHPRHDPAPDGARPQAAHVLAQRPRRAADRRRAAACSRRLWPDRPESLRFQTGHFGSANVSAGTLSRTLNSETSWARNGSPSRLTEILVGLLRPPSPCSRCS